MVFSGLYLGLLGRKRLSEKREWPGEGGMAERETMKEKASCAMKEISLEVNEMAIQPGSAREENVAEESLSVSLALWQKRGKL